LVCGVDTASNPGGSALLLLDGATGQVRWETICFREPDAQLWEATAVIDRRDGRGHDVLVVGRDGGGRSEARLLSGKTGDILRSVEFAEDAQSRVSRLCALGDLSGDGVDEIAISRLFVPPGGPGVVSVVVVDGVSLEEQFKLSTGRHGNQR
jgi:hypothetical protein